MILCGGAKNFAETPSALRVKACAQDCPAIYHLWIFQQGPSPNYLTDLNFYVIEKLVIKLHKRWETKVGTNYLVIPRKNVLQCV